MTALSKILPVVLCLSSIFCVILADIEPYSSRETSKQSISLNQPEVVSTFQRLEEDVPTLLSVLQVFGEIALTCLWVVDGCLSACLWILNETFSSCAQLTFSIFGIFFNVVKLLEAFGFGVKFLLEMNFAVLSYIFDSFASMKETFKHAILLVKITIVNETAHVCDSGAMALEGVQNLFFTMFYQTWSRVQYFISFVADNFTSPFGVSTVDLHALSSLCITGVQFFWESIIVTAKVFKDGTTFLFTYIVDGLSRLGVTVVQNAIATLRFLGNQLNVIISYTIFILTWPLYFVANTFFKICDMLYFSWQAFVKWIGWADLFLREMIWAIMSSISKNIHAIIEILNFYFPGGCWGCFAVAFMTLLVFLGWEKILSTLAFLKNNFERMNQHFWLENNIQPNQEYLLNHEEIREEAHEEIHVEARFAETSSSSREQQNDAHKLKHELEQEKDKRLCVICQDSVKNVLLLPCRHVCMCQGCLLEVRHGPVRIARCPLCRQHIESTLEVFV